jgi:hypothetical protein
MSQVNERGSVVRMRNERMPKQVVIIRMEGKRKKGRPWKDGSDKVGENIKEKGIRN